MGWLHVEPYMFDVARLVEADEALGEGFDLVFRKNEAILDGVVRNSFVLVEFEEGGGVFEVAALALGAVGLDLAEHVQGFLKLAGEPLGVHAEGGQLRDQGLGAGGLGEKLGFELGDAVETPGGVGEFLSELGLGGSGGLVFVDELAAVELVGGGVLGSEDGGAAGEAVGGGIQGRTLFAGGGAGSGGEERVRAIASGYWRLAIGGWRGNGVCHI
jgi:hypothetical protein